jgi:hypothetical protein
MAKKSMNPWMSMSGQEIPLMMQGVLGQDGNPLPEAPAPAMSMASMPSLPAAPDKYEELMKRLEGRTLQGINDQRESIKKLREYQDKIRNKESQVDLSPLMRLADQWSGSKLSAGYQAPETADERQARLMGIEQQIAGQSSKITDDELGLLKTQMMGEMYRNKADAAAQKGTSLNDLSGESKKMVGLANEGINAVTGMEQAMANGVGPSRVNPSSPLIGSFVSDNAFTSNQRIAAEMFGRLQSGGAINKEEEDRFIAMGPRPGDDTQMAMQKLAAQKAALQDRLRIVGASPEMLSQAGVHSRSSVPSGAPAGKPSFEEWKKSKGF